MLNTIWHITYLFSCHKKHRQNVFDQFDRLARWYVAVPFFCHCRGEEHCNKQNFIIKLTLKNRFLAPKSSGEVILHVIIAPLYEK